MISSGATFYLREAPRGSVHSLKEEREDRNENIPSIQDLLEKYQRKRLRFKRRYEEELRKRLSADCGQQHISDSLYSRSKCHKKKLKSNDRKPLNCTVLVTCNEVKNWQKLIGAFQSVRLNVLGCLPFLKNHKLYDNAKPLKHMCNNNKKML